MVKAHQCEVMAEMAQYILIDNYYVDGELAERFKYFLQASPKGIEGKKVDWLHCPYCGDKLY